MGKLPTSYRPPASHASAMSLQSRRIGSYARACSSGGLASGAPFSSRPRIAARSKRNPSMWYSLAQYRRQDRMKSRTTGLLQLKLFPVPLKL